MSSQDALQLFAICPSSLCQNGAAKLLGPDFGRFLVKFPITRLFRSSCWQGRNLSDPEIRAARDNLDLLERKGAVVRYNPATNGIQAQDKWEAVLKELSDDGCYLTGALVENIDIGPVRHVAKKLYSIQNGFEPPRHSKIFVDYDARSLIEVFRTAIQNSDTFKIVDPYIFEITSPNQASARMKFVEELTLEIEKSDQGRASEKVIEIYGREDKIGNVEALKGHLRSCPNLQLAAQRYEVRFFGIKHRSAQALQQGEASKFHRKKMHDRYFYAGGNVFEIEDTFEDRRDTSQQWVRLVEDSEEREFVRIAFTHQSSQYPVCVSFTLKQVFQ